ncbi:MAG: hypothetical protein JNK82_29765, partial [Myxococcaceae bacterium]|nr:hypothetical protein [Myxococcaceae bacterium]
GLLFAACQSEAEAMRVVCDAPIACTKCMEAPPADKAILLARHITEGVRNDEVKKMFSGLASVSAEEKVRLLADRAKAAGITKCAMLEVWAQ